MADFVASHVAASRCSGAFHNSCLRYRDYSYCWAGPCGISACSFVAMMSAVTLLMTAGGVEHHDATMMRLMKSQADGAVLLPLPITLKLCRSLIEKPWAYNPQNSRIYIKNPNKCARFLNQVPALGCW